MQVVDNKVNKFFCFPMISMVCTGSGYKKKSQIFDLQIFGSFLFILMFPNCSRISSYKLLKKVLSYKYRELTVFCI